MSGVEYQRGELFGFEARERLLTKFGWGRAYRGAENVRLQIDHVGPKAKGGSNRISNLVISRERRDREKGDRDF
ncbi:MAG: hypothetical protein LBI10_00230 [Deltaproteobacteria bacterium]|nr:hypothetical protein [Deltaproteobacteria bacterium]